MYSPRNPTATSSSPLGERAHHHQRRPARDRHVPQRGAQQRDATERDAEEPDQQAEQRGDADRRRREARQHVDGELDALAQRPARRAAAAATPLVVDEGLGEAEVVDQQVQRRVARRARQHGVDHPPAREHEVEPRRRVVEPREHPEHAVVRRSEPARPGAVVRAVAAAAPHDVDARAQRSQHCRQRLRRILPVGGHDGHVPRARARARSASRRASRRSSTSSTTAPGRSAPERARAPRRTSPSVEPSLTTITSTRPARPGSSATAVATRPSVPAMTPALVVRRHDDAQQRAEPAPSPRERGRSWPRRARRRISMPPPPPSAQGRATAAASASATRSSCSRVMPWNSGRMSDSAVRRSVTGSGGAGQPGARRLEVGGHDAAARRDPLLEQRLHDGVAARRRARRRAAPRRTGSWCVPCGGSLGEAQAGDAGERRSVAVGEPPALGHHRVELVELGEADGGLEVGHAEVEAELGVLLEHDGAPLACRSWALDDHPVLAQPPQPAGQLGVGRQQHPALAGGDELARMERERDRAGRRRPAGRDRWSRWRTPRPRSRSRRAAAQTASIASDVGRHARLVDDDHRPGRGRQRSRDGVRRDVLRLERRRRRTPAARPRSAARWR